MSFAFRPCTLEMDFDAYVTFLLRHDRELGLPYPFPVKLSFLSSPLILGKAMLVISEEPYDIVGAAGFVYGTGPRDYEDREVCQIEVAFLREGCRGSLLFARGLQALVAEMKAGNPDVSQVQFWAPAAPEEPQERLFGRLSALPGASRAVVNDLALYTVPFVELERYSRRLNRCDSPL